VCIFILGDRQDAHRDDRRFANAFYGSRVTGASAAEPVYLVQELGSFSTQRKSPDGTTHRISGSSMHYTISAIDRSGSQPATALTSGHVEAVVKNADGGQAVLFTNLGTGTGTGTGTFTLPQLGISTARASGYNVWKNSTSTFSSVSVTLPAGQTETVVIKPIN